MDYAIMDDTTKKQWMIQLKSNDITTTTKKKNGCYYEEKMDVTTIQIRRLKKSKYEEKLRRLKKSNGLLHLTL